LVNGCCVHLKKNSSFILFQNDSSTEKTKRKPNAWSHFLPAGGTSWGAGGSIKKPNDQSRCSQTCPLKKRNGWKKTSMNKEKTRQEKKEKISERAYGGSPIKK